MGQGLWLLSPGNPHPALGCCPPFSCPKSWGTNPAGTKHLCGQGHLFTSSADQGGPLKTSEDADDHQRPPTTNKALSKATLCVSVSLSPSSAGTARICPCRPEATHQCWEGSPAPCPAPVGLPIPSALPAPISLKDKAPRAAEQPQYPPSALSQFLLPVPPKPFTLCSTFSMPTMSPGRSPFTHSLIAANCPSLGSASALFLQSRFPSTMTQHGVPKSPPLGTSNLLSDDR